MIDLDVKKLKLLDMTDRLNRSMIGSQLGLTCIHSS